MCLLDTMGAGVLVKLKLVLKTTIFSEKCGKNIKNNNILSTAIYIEVAYTFSLPLDLEGASYFKGSVNC